MDIKQLESFLAISKTKSFSRAAEMLYLTQPTISSHIQALESELGTILFNRLNRKVTLTQSGEILYDYAMAIIYKKDSAIYALNEYKGKIEGVLEIASSSIPEQYFLTDIISKFHHKNPLVKYILYKHDTGEVIDKLLQGEIDFGIVGSKRENKSLEYIEILDDEMVLILSKEKADEIGSEIDLKEMINLDFIMREESSGSRDTMEKALAKEGIDLKDLNVSAVIEDNETVKKFVIKGIGATLISNRAIERELKSGELAVVNVRGLEIKRKFYFAYHKKRLLSPLTVAFKDFLTENI